MKGENKMEFLSISKSESEIIFRPTETEIIIQKNYREFNIRKEAAKKFKQGLEGCSLDKNSNKQS